MIVMKAQASVVVGLILLIILFSVMIPFLVFVMTSPSYNIQGKQYISQAVQARDQQMFQIESGDPLISYIVTPNGQDVLSFEFLHGFYPLQIKGIYYFNGTSWVPAYPGNLTVSSDLTIYLFTPSFYTGPIDIVTSYANQIILYPKMFGGVECTNIWTLFLNSQKSSAYITLYPGQNTQIVYIYTGSSSEETVTSEMTLYLPNGTEIFEPNATALPALIGSGEIVALPNGTTIIFPNPNNGVVAIKIIKDYATVEVSGGYILQKCLHASGLPLSSFLTGYQSDNDNIGMLNVTKYGGSNNPMLQSQTIIQWVIPDSGIHQGLVIPYVTASNDPPPPPGPQNCINLLSSGPKANVPYYSNYAPLGGYAVWTGDAGIVIGNGIGNNPGPGGNNNFYIAFTVQLYNGTWVTIVDPNPVPAETTLNGNQATYLMMIAGSYNASTGVMSLYVNGSLVSQVQLKPNLLLNNSPRSIIDVGSVYNGSNGNLLKSLPGVAGDVFTGDSQSYSFDGALGPTIIYNVSLTPQAISFLYHGGLPDFNDIIIMWTQNYVVYSKILKIYPLQTEECYSTQQPQGGNGQYGHINGQMVGYEVYNLVNESQYDAFWGLAGAIPTAFTPFGALVLWSGGTPLVFNPSILSETGQNVTVEYQATLVPPEKGTYTFSYNFTDCPPGITAETHGGQVVWANEYGQVYINGKLVFSGYMTDKQIHVLYSDDPSAISKNQPIFDYTFAGSVNITIVFTFNIPHGYSTSQPLGIFFGLMWIPPGFSSFIPVPISSFQTPSE
ncbi:hypothetical protein DDW09_03455 [Sulfolobus sp. SCGC AB-777_L09]|nr:hypothetical protein DDW09_03455 [Sulfolobus sp. SCGC AB-777_L09]